MKLKKKSGLISAVVALSAASLVSVGFASWVISQGDAATISGNFVAEAVDNKSHLIKSIAAGAGDAGTYNGEANPKTFTFSAASNINFGAKNDEEALEGKTIWLTNDAFNENLDVSFVITVSNVYPNDEEALGNNVQPTWFANPVFAVSGTYHEGQPDAASFQSIFDACVTAHYISGPTYTYSHVKSGTDDVMTMTVSFAWGSHFLTKNPYVYYNEQAMTPALVEDATTALEQIYKLNGAGYSLSLVINAEAD